ncbi:outer membrane beta-barrel protein [Parapedobacter sp. GCM10030251]|uniref:type IX secretion/gliding motility protein PorT/SprT n=1 Tax=Parapedobacter sp. GCM10030251 TaxID=3273419 RepID=UPI00361DFAD4
MNVVYPISVRFAMGLLLLLTASSAYAQQKFQRWGGGVDDEPLHFGFSFHYINADYKITLKPDWQTPNPMASAADTASLLGVSSPFYHGVGLGLLADIKLTENANLRFTPSLVFSNKVVNYKYSISTEVTERLIRASYIDLPLLIKFKSDRKGNYRGYLIGGGKYSINVVSGKRYDDASFSPAEKLLKTKPGYFSYEAGIGFDLYFDFFKMSPEVRWVQSVGNLLDRSEYNMYNRPIDRLTLRNFQVSLFFE